MFKCYAEFTMTSKGKKMKLTKYRWGCYQAPCMGTSEATKLQAVRLRSTGAPPHGSSNGIPNL